MSASLSRGILRLMTLCFALGGSVGTAVAEPAPRRVADASGLLRLIPLPKEVKLDRQPRLPAKPAKPAAAK